MTKWKVSGFRPSPMQGEGFWLYSSYPGVIAPKVLTYPKSLGSHKETDGLCHPGCVIIPTGSNLPTVKITSCVIIHRLLTLSFHSRIRSRLYLYINKIPSEAFFFPVLILKISILLSRIQIFPFSNINFEIAASSLPLPPQPLSVSSIRQGSSSRFWTSLPSVAFASGSIS